MFTTLLVLQILHFIHPSWVVGVLGCIPVTWFMWPIVSAHDEAMGRDFAFSTTYMLLGLGERWGNLVTYIISLLSEIMAGCSMCCHLCCCILTWPYIPCYDLFGYFPWRCSHGRYCYHSQLWGCDYTLRLLCTTLSLTQSSVWRGCVVLPVLQFSIILHGGWCLLHHMIPVELSWHLIFWWGLTLTLLKSRILCRLLGDKPVPNDSND